MPLNQLAWERLSDIAEDLYLEYQFNPERYNDNHHIPEWSQETFKIGVQNLYNGIKENTPLPDDYVARN
jgi:hypothetical protein